jgi:hypothetical protein
MPAQALSGTAEEIAHALGIITPIFTSYVGHRD